jgi:hypothetical protein
MLLKQLGAPRRAYFKLTPAAVGWSGWRRSVDKSAAPDGTPVSPAAPRDPE